MVDSERAEIRRWAAPREQTRAGRGRRSLARHQGRVLRPMIAGAALLALSAASRQVWAASLAELAERAARSVVKLDIYGARGDETGSGTGFFVTADGRILTNDHVVAGASEVRAVLHDGRSVRTVGILARDEERDIALLQAEAGPYVPLTLGSSAGLRPGDDVIVLGSPRGFAGSLSAGIVSAVRERGVDEGDGFGRYWKLQVTAPISSGSSGSPIMDRDGHVVAVVVGQTESGQALNFGVPIEDARVLVERARGAEVTPWARAPGGRSLWENLAISAAAVALALVGLASASRLGLRDRRSARTRRRQPFWSS